ncbi:LytTR family transcriptional regulator DNA-binding domain-containing protein [Fibrella arboris]|uniref:LytTR family transcriptional regulator DNA-binding domain-containing protein n=1 Tax=Fibrella arboris TaxID=3242486 RepID=UPI0035208F06
MSTSFSEAVLLDQCVFIPVRVQQYERVLKEQIQFFQAEGSWVDLFTTLRTYRLSTNIGQVALQVDPTQFVRVSRRHIVNIQRVRALSGNELFVDDTPLLVGKQYRAGLIERLPIIRMKATSSMAAP